MERRKGTSFLADGKKREGETKSGERKGKKFKYRE